MRNRIMYIERKTGFGESGSAWIGEVEYSKSGRTIYFNGQAFKANRVPGGPGNYWDLETEEEYWISGVKKNGLDRHWSAGGKVMIDRNIIEDYLKLVEFPTLDKYKFELVDILATDKLKFAELENEKSED